MWGAMSERSITKHFGLGLAAVMVIVLVLIAVSY